MQENVVNDLNQQARAGAGAAAARRGGEAADESFEILHFSAPSRFQGSVVL